MIGFRARIVLLSSFFTFAFSMLFLALVENYAHAGDAMGSVNAAELSADIQLPLSDIVPTYGIVSSKRAYDFDSDDSLQRYLSPDRPFHDASYVPADLVPIDSDFTANNSRAFKLRQDAAVHFADMAWHFRRDFSGDRIALTSAYRSKSLQDYLVRQGCDSTKCAQPGTSEHQAGLAVDIRIVTKGGKSYALDADHPNKYFDWLKTHAAEFGFHNTYQKGVDIDGKIAEGWHRRYLGAELAKILADNDQTFAEYYFKTK